MTGTLVRHLALGAVATVVVGLPILAKASDDVGMRPHRHHTVRSLPSGPYNRNPRYLPTRRQAPDFLIQAYLPRTTEAPIYNEPPSRFPGR